jgi:hypothetical protein
VADGGSTSVDNFALLCKRDHTAVHNGHLTIHITNGHRHATRPTWANPNPPPRRQPPQPPIKPQQTPTIPPQGHDGRAQVVDVAQVHDLGMVAARHGMGI